MDFYTRIRFSEIKSKVPPRPGIYEIHTDSGLPLKVGIGGDIQKRLLQHAESRQRGLKLKQLGSWQKPADVESKRSILAKHLYFADLGSGLDLKTELGRQQFLLAHCYILFRVTSTRAEARDIERAIEAGRCFRFVGKTALNSVL